jgi:hypothetical protein
VLFDVEPVLMCCLHYTALHLIVLLVLCYLTTLQIKRASLGWTTFPLVPSDLKVRPGSSKSQKKQAPKQPTIASNVIDGSDVGAKTGAGKESSDTDPDATAKQPAGVGGAGDVGAPAKPVHVKLTASGEGDGDEDGDEEGSSPIDDDSGSESDEGEPHEVLVEQFLNEGSPRALVAFPETVRSIMEKVRAASVRAA